MEQITLAIKDERKRDLLLSLLKELSFVEVIEQQNSTSIPDEPYDFFASAGLWKGREIDGKELRTQAWKRNH